MRTRSAALAAFVGAALWGLKALAILIAGWQPPLAFELGPLFFALACVGISRSTGPRAIGVAALVAGAVAAVAFVAGREEVGGAALGISMLATLASLGWHGWRTRERRRLPLVIAIATVPLVGIGGALSLLDERLLELPILALAVLWAALAARVWTDAPG